MDGMISSKPCWKTVALCAVLGIFASLLLIGCAEKEEPLKQVNIKIINVNGMIQDDVFPPLAKQYAAAHSDRIVHCTPETASSDIQPDELAGLLTGCDAVVFPSLLNQKCRAQADLFYPIQDMGDSCPPVLDAAYAGTTQNSNWAVPLVLDPVVMIVKKNGPNDENPPSSWSAVTMHAQLFNLKPPHLVFITGDPLSLADSIAFQQFSAGFKADVLHNAEREEGVTEKDQLGIFARSLMNLKPYMADSAQARLQEIPQVKDLQAFFQSNALASFCRYSEYLRLPENLQNQMAVFPLPNNYGPVAVCYVIAAGVPVQSANPAMGEDFIRFLQKEIQSIALKQNYLVSHIPSDNQKGIGVFPPQAVFVPRESGGALSEKLVIDAVNGDLGIHELNSLWMDSFFIPSAHL
ncbi:MAG: substrate-binding domain-containing protein [Candidatus Omnitrophica bacterium]|nr:substrate-binding domain-containing protein [Candidatus Omnitrophota bacterium]